MTGPTVGLVPHSVSDLTRSGAYSPSAKPSLAPPGEAEDVGSDRVEVIEDADGVGNPGLRVYAATSCGLSLRPCPRWSAKYSGDRARERAPADSPAHPPAGRPTRVHQDRWTFTWPVLDVRLYAVEPVGRVGHGYVRRRIVSRLASSTAVSYAVTRAAIVSGLNRSIIVVIASGGWPDDLRCGQTVVRNSSVSSVAIA